MFFWSHLFIVIVAILPYQVMIIVKASVFDWLCDTEMYV